MKTNYYNEKGELVEQKPKYKFLKYLREDGTTCDARLNPNHFEKVRVVSEKKNGDAIFEVWNKECVNHIIFSGKINEGKKTVFTKYFDSSSNVILDASSQPHDFKKVQYLGKNPYTDFFKALDSDEYVHFYSGIKGDEFND